MPARRNAAAEAQVPLRPHEQSAKTNVLFGFMSSPCGKLIMACGTGETFTRLKIAEDVVRNQELPMTNTEFNSPPDRATRMTSPASTSSSRDTRIAGGALRRLLALLLGIGLAGLAQTVRAETPRLVVAIVVDQLRYDYLERFSGLFPPGGFRLFTEKGAFLTFARYDYCPTVTGPGHASIFGGCGPSMHGIIANDWIDRKTGLGVYCCGDDSVHGVGTGTNSSRVSPRNFIGSNFADQLRLQYRSKVVGVSMKDRGAILPAGKKPAGAYWFDSKSGNFVTSSYYVPELPDWVARFNARHRAAAFADTNWNRLAKLKDYPYPDDGPGEGRLGGETNSLFPHRILFKKDDGFDAVVATPFGNQILEEFAEAAIEGEGLGRGPQPDLLCVSFSSLDAVGHRFGPYSHEAQDALLRLDRQLADLFRFLDAKVGLHRVQMVLTADHGVMPNPEFAVSQGLDGRRINEADLLVDLLNRLDKAFGAGKYLLKPGFYGGDLYFNQGTLREKGLKPAKVAAFIRDWALSSGKFQACYSRDQLLEGLAPGMVGRLTLNGYHAERGGDVVLIPKPFFVPSSGAAGTTHGSPFTQDTHVPVLFYGTVFNRGRFADEFYISDIAPTLCAALRMDAPSGCTGRPFVKVLRNAH